MTDDDWALTKYKLPESMKLLKKVGRKRTCAEFENLSIWTKRRRLNETGLSQIDLNLRVWSIETDNEDSIWKKIVKKVKKLGPEKALQILSLADDEKGPTNFTALEALRYL